MLFYLLFYLLLFINLIITPFVVFRHILIGDEYLLATSPIYGIFWLIAVTFLSSYFWTSIKNFYECFVAKPTNDPDDPKKSTWGIFRSFHSIVIASIYSAISESLI